VPTNFAKSPSRQADKPLLTKTRRFTSDENFDLTGSGYLYVLSTFSYLVAALCLEGRGTSYVGWGLLLLEYQPTASSSFDLDAVDYSLRPWLS